MSSERDATAAHRFAAFLSSRGADERDVIAPEMTVWRCGFDAERGQVVETIQGRHAVIKWAEKSPEGIAFRVSQATDGVATYVITVAGFVGGGTWTVQTNDDGTIASLRHQPDDLDANRQKDPEWRDAIETIDEARAE